MKKISLRERHRNEKAVIDALLKISEIVKKTEANQKSINTNRLSKKTVGDGDYNEFNSDHQPQQVPIPPPMRTLDSYISGLNQPSNCNQASKHYPRNLSKNTLDKQCDRVLKKQLSDMNDRKRRYYDTSSTTSFSSNDDHQRKKSTCQNTEKIENSQTTSYQMNSAATTIHADQSTSLIMTPITSAPTIPPPSINLEQQQEQFSSSSEILKNSKRDFDVFIDQQLQSTLEKHLKNYLLSSIKIPNETLQQKRKTRLSNLTRSEREKLINNLDFTKQIPDFEYYEKQRELAIVAAQQGNYSLSYSIYTNLLHDNQYDIKLKSEILSSRATILLLEEKFFESIDDCTQAIVYNQWNKLAYVVRAACWMIKHQYLKAIKDYSKLFHFFDQSQYILDLLNLAYEKSQSSSSTTSFIQPIVYLYYPYQTYEKQSIKNNSQSNLI